MSSEGNSSSNSAKSQKKTKRSSIFRNSELAEEISGDGKGAIKKKNGNSTKGKGNPANSKSNGTSVFESPNGGKNAKSKQKKKLVQQGEDAGNEKQYSSPRYWRSSWRQTSSDNSDLYSDISSKINSSGNLRAPKMNRTISVPDNNKILNQPLTPRIQGNRSKTPENNHSSSASTTIQGKKNSPKKKNTKFEPYISLFQLQQGLKRGEFIEGALRINPRNYEDAYVSAPDGNMDIYIGGMHNRNRAFNGDIVAVQINPKQEWRLLRDAIKDYQEKSGESVIDAVCKPASPTCKIHTPDTRSVRSRPMSCNSWDMVRRERLPDTLEILGIDKLAQQIEDISLHRETRKRGKTKLKKDEEDLKEVAEDRSSTSYSQSSEDCLDKKNIPDKNATKDGQGAPLERINCAQKSDVVIRSATMSDFKSHGKEHAFSTCDAMEIGTFNTNDVPVNQCISSNWDEGDPSMNIIVSPEQLLQIDGNSLLEQEDIEFDSDNEAGGIAVAPEDLSGDEFTDSASIGSSDADRLEDMAFLASQQDAENNNVENYQVDNQVNANELIRTGNLNETNYVLVNMLPSASTGNECGLQQNRVLPILEQVEIESNDVMCSVVSNHHAINNHSSSDEAVHIQTLPVSEILADNIVQNVSESAPPTEKKKKSRRRKKKNANKAESKFKSKSPSIVADVESLTIDQVMEHPQWSKFIQKTGKVVYIVERKHSCLAAGYLKLCPDRNRNWALFSPKDSRVPRIMVPIEQCPQSFYYRPSDFANVLFLVEILEWTETSNFALGRIVKDLGNAGNIEGETKGILLENGIDCRDFNDKVLKCLPKGDTFRIPDEELKLRKDFRKDCIFTIDPATARDMDDAVSCTELDNGNYEVGVHIADVTYFVEPNTELDVCAMQRSTSVYLVEKVIPMLPRKLCDNLCSLNPGQDRLTYSIIWELTPAGDIVNQWIGRSIINSCIKMSYEHAQSMIEDSSKEWKLDEYPTMYSEFTIHDVVRRVLNLHRIAVELRKKRFDSGALQLDQIKLQFTLDSESGLPSGYYSFMAKESNKLIEEFMLLANMSVAKKIYETFPSLSLLRRHPPPDTKCLNDVVSMCESMGIILDTTSSGTLHQSLEMHRGGKDFESVARFNVLVNLLSKPMNQALYFCSGTIDDPPLFHHYALCVPLYTHFTSPIRRYPDIIVHRLLGAALGYSDPPNMSMGKMKKCADHCNDKKYNAKRVSEQSSELFLAAFIKKLGSLSTRAMVIGVLDHSFDCLIVEMGTIKRVYCDKLPLVKKEFARSHGVSRLNLFWKNGLEQVIVVFATVNIALSVDDGSLLIKATLQMPEM